MIHRGTIIFVLVPLLCLVTGTGRAAPSKGLDAALLRAVENDDLTMVKAMLTQGANPNAKDESRLNTPVLTRAVVRGNRAIMQVLLDKGADINGKGAHGFTALHLIAGKGKVEAIKFLLTHGADVNARTDEGETPLISAVFIGQSDNVKFLLANGADVNARNKNGKTALGLVKGHKHKVEVIRNAMVKLLTEAGAKE